MARVPGLRQLVHLVPLGRLNKALLQRHIKQGCFDDALLDHYVGWMDTREGRRWVTHFFRHYQMPARRDLDLEIDRIVCPTTIIWGDRDPYCPVEIGRDLAA
ncbi:MAG: alpha/beta hydrolase, partial [Pseudomonadota bacterium]